MPTYKNPIEYTILAGGLAQTTDVGDLNKIYKVVGTATITVNNTFTHTGTLSEGLEYEYDYRAAATYSGGVVSFHGVAMTATQALKNHTVKAKYNGSAWEVDFHPILTQDGVIEAAKLASDSVITAKILDLNVTTAKINDLAVTTGKINDLAITTGKIADLGVTTAKINDLGVTTGKINDLGVTTAKIADLNVTTGKINDLAITTAKIAADNVTVAKLETSLKTEVFHFEMESTVAMLRTAYFKMPWTCTVTEVDVRVSQVLAGGDLTVTPMDNAGTTMTGGPITIPLATAIGSGVNATITANNTFTAGQYMRIQTSGAAVTDGLVSISVTVLRT